MRAIEVLPPPPGEGRGEGSSYDLLKLPGVWRGGELEHAALPAVPTGHAALDAELPGGGWPCGTLTEVLHDAQGIGEVGFLAGALARAATGDRLVAWINPPHLPYAPALAQAGVPLERVLVVRPVNREDALWAAEQSLKSGACGAVLLWLGEEGERRHDEYAWLRRLQMAAQAGRALAIHYRTSAARERSTPAHLRVALARSAEGLEIRIPKRRGPPLTRPVVLPVRGGYTARPASPEPRRTRQGVRPLVDATAAPAPAPREAIDLTGLHLVSR